jgi:hypothetical protein
VSSSVNNVLSPVSLPSQSSPSIAATPSRLPAVVSVGPFQVKLLTPSIKVCAGCRGGYDRAPPPMDIILVRKERHLYYNAVNQRQQLSALSNVHYHANVVCPRLKFPLFEPNSVEVPEEVRSKLLPEHWLFLLQTFGIM